ncbi:MAG: glycosyltransferase [Phycisphaerae bacterium]|nr:glycosyltransferase [Phycisphaerae bacterium]
MGMALRVLQVNSADSVGGAEKVGFDLHRAYLQRGLEAWLAVGRKLTGDASVLAMSGGPRAGRERWPVARRLIRWARTIRDDARGYESFEHPATWRLLDLPPARPDILHLHNLHGYYFDLRALSWLSGQVPTFLTLHDPWLLAGHCAHSFACDRWKAGCGQCPDLSIYPTVRRDATAHNWAVKREIYGRSHVYVATPSRWLMDRVSVSMLAPAVVEARVIPNGVDLRHFHPADRAAARAAVGLPRDAKMLLFAANGIRANPWKDYRTMRAAVAALAERHRGEDLLFVALGETAPGDRVGQAEIRFVPFESDPARVACYYQAADVYLHAAKVDTFPNVVLEALACGTPVAATAVGGIPEQIIENRTGLLTPPGDADAMAAAARRLLADESLRFRMGSEAVADARRRFSLDRQVGDYLGWYEDVVSRSEHPSRATSR